MFVQKIKRSIFNLLVLAQLVTPITAMAAGDSGDLRPSAKDEMVAATGNLLVNTLNKYNDKINLKWVKGGFRAMSNGEHSFDLKALTVIKEYAKHVLFTQYGLSKNGDGSTLNAGVGFYQLLTNNIMVGANTFYDARTGTKGILNPFGDGVHKRFSLGGTIMTSQAGMFFNVYRGLSDSIARYKVSDGYDFGINGSIPGAESVNLGVTHYDFNKENRGSKFKIEYKPNSLFTFGVEQDISDNPSASLYIETKYEFNKPLEEQLQSTSRFSGDVWSQRYNEVERDNNVTLELAVVDFTMATPTSVPFGTTVELRPLASGGGDGELSFEEVEADDDVTVDTVTGTVASVKPAEVEVNVTRAALGDYDESTITVTVIFTELEVKLVDDAKDKGLLSSEQGEGEGFGVDLTKAIVTVGTGGVSYALKPDGTKENKSKTASSPTSHPLGASITEKGFLTATKAGTVAVVVSQNGDDNYDASVLDVYVDFSKSSKGIEVAVPKSVDWGKSVELNPLVSGGGEGKLTFEISEDAENTIGANVILGVVTANSPGTIEVTVNREQDEDFKPSDANVTVTFERKTEQLTGLTTKRIGVMNYEYTIAGIGGAGDEASDLSYALKSTNPSNMGDVKVQPTTGVISGVDKVGKVIVTVTHAQDDNYNRVYGDVTVDYIDMPLLITVTDQEVLNSQVWDADVDFNLANYIAGGGTGPLTFAKAEANDDTQNIDITENGEIRARAPGVLKVLVSRGKSTDFAASEKEVTVTFGKKTRDIDTVTKPATVKWGSPSSFERPADLEFTYTIDAEKNTEKGAKAQLTELTGDSINGVQVDATGAGDVIVTMSIDGDEYYNKYTQYVTVSFDKEDSTINDITAPASVEWGTDSEITGVSGTGGQTFEYTINKEKTKIDAEVGLTTGIVKSKEPGSVHVTVTHTANEDYSAHSQDVEVLFGLATLDFTIANPDTVIAGAEVDLSKLVITMPDGVEKGTLKYEIDGNNSINATLTGSTVTSDFSGSVRIKVTRAEDGKYKESIKFVNVTFDFNGQESPATLAGKGQVVPVSTPMKVGLLPIKPGYKMIRSINVTGLVGIPGLAGYNDNNQSWKISTDIDKTWDYNNSSERNKMHEAVNGDSWPNCAISNKVMKQDSNINSYEQVVYVKEGETCSLDVTFYRNGNYKGKTEQVDFRADSTQRSNSSADVDNLQILSGLEATVGTGENTFIIKPLDGFSNPDAQEVIYQDSHSALSVQSNGLPWLATEVTNTFLDGLGRDTACIAVSDNNVQKVYVRKDLIKNECEFSVIFSENSQYLQVRQEVALFGAGKPPREHTIGSKVLTVAHLHNSLRIEGFQRENIDEGIYMVDLFTLPNSTLKGLDRDLIVNSLDVETASGGGVIEWLFGDTTIVPEKINNMQKCLLSTQVTKLNPIIYIKEGVTCTLDITLPATSDFLEKTERLTLIATGKDDLLNNDSTVGYSSYKTYFSESNTFNYVTMRGLERENGFFVASNSHDDDSAGERFAITYSGVDVSTNGGSAWTTNPDLDLEGKNCVIVKNGSNDVMFYVKKGTSCAIDVTFPADDGHLAKTETLTLFAD